MMTEDPRPEPDAPRRRLERWRSRLDGRVVSIGAAVVALLVLVALGQLPVLAAVLTGLVLALVLVVLLPSRKQSTIVGPAAPGTAARDTLAGAFADALPDPCMIIDRRGVVLHVNAAAMQEFGTTRAGDPIAFSFRNPSLLTAIEGARRSGEAQSVEMHRTLPTETWHKVSVAPLAGTDRLVISMRSLTEEKRIDALRTDFIANASHELRTPLTSLVGFIDTLLGPAARDAAAREKFLGIMRNQAARMSKLIDDLLSLSRIEMRKHVRPTGRVDLSGLLREVREGLQTQAEQSDVTVDIAAPDEAVVTGDRDELYEVFENLIDNAIKYGGDGGRVEVGLHAVGDRPGYDYAIEVRDHGAGIAPEHVPRLTERFYRVDAESSRRKKGTGLGLAIVKHIVQRHRGTLSIRSELGAGTRVEVLLPR